MYIAIQLFKRMYSLPQDSVWSGTLQWQSCDACCIQEEFSDSLVSIHVVELMVVHVYSFTLFQWAKCLFLLLLYMIALYIN